MLMRYAENLAHGHGIVWNVGEAPVDGATDFLFMTSVSALISAGLTTGRSVRVLGLAAHAITVLLVYAANRRIWQASVLVSLITALYIAVGPGLWYVAAYFGTPAFALTAAISWWFALRLMQRPNPKDLDTWGFAVFGLVAGLMRPEGVLLAFYMLLAVVLARGWRDCRRITVQFGLVMFIFGGLYFAWHWNYFGHPLPNPYYRKGAGILHWDSLWESFRYLLHFAGPFAVAFVLALRSGKTLRQAYIIVLPMLLFAASFALVSNATNFFGRFQYALEPMVLMSYYPLVMNLPSELHLGPVFARPGLSSRSLFLIALVSVLVSLGDGATQVCVRGSRPFDCGNFYEADGRYDVAKKLASYRDRGYVIATSEAGLLPLYSGWRAVDTWGLNDAWIAQNGEITAKYLDSYRPAVIVFHAYFSPLVPAGTSDNDMQNSWHRMTLTLQNYAETNDYILAAAFGDTPTESHYYYVRRDLAESESIVRAIAGTRPYYWNASGRKAFNYATLKP